MRQGTPRVGSFRRALPHFVDLYTRMGYNYSPVVFGVHAEVRSNPEKQCVEVSLPTLGDAPISPDGMDRRLQSTLQRRRSRSARAARSRPWLSAREPFAGAGALFADNKAMGHPVVMRTQPLEKYPVSVLRPRSWSAWRATSSYANGDWTGWFGDPMDVVIDMSGASYSEVCASARSSRRARISSCR